MRYQRYSNNKNYLWLIFLFLIMFGGLRFIILLFGLALALIINFFPLIIMGYIAYRFIKKVGRNRYVHSSFNTKSTDHKRFVELMIHMLIHIAKADGKITQPETQAIRQFFIQQLNFSGPKIEWINDTIESAKTSTDALHVLANEFTRQFSYESQLMLINMVYNVAYSDGELHDREVAIINQLVSLMQISNFDHQRIKMAFEAQFGSIANETSDAKHYAVLGLTDHAKKDQIKKAYRDLTKKYHPDKVHHLGDEFKIQAEKKMQKINLAHDELMKRAVA